MKKQELISPLKAIKAFCKDCTGNSSKELRLCPCNSCPLHPFRFGTSPFRKRRELSDDERQKIGQFLKEKRGGVL